MARPPRKPWVPTGRGRGRPTVLSEALTATICQYLLDGGYLDTACAAAGIGRTTMHSWLKLAAEADAKGLEDTPWQDFRNAVEEAQAEAEARDLRLVTKAAQKNWKAAAWRLERRKPKRWAPARRVMDDEEGDADSSAFRFSYSLDDDGDDDGTGDD